MTSPPVLDISALLEPIAGDNPAGEKYLPQAVQDKLDTDRKEVEAEEGSPEEPKKADWKNIVRTASDTLTRTSKSLLVAARLVEGLTKQHGFAGLRDGLHLLRDLIEQCWDRMYPALSEPEEGESDEEAVERQNDDLERRAGPFHWLSEPDRGARFPPSLRMVPMVFGPDGAFGWSDWRQAVDGKGVSMDVYEKAVLATPAERCQTALDDLSAARDELNQLAQSLDTRLGSLAPAFTGLRQAIDDCHALLAEIVQRKDPGGAESQAPEEAEGETAASPVRGAVRPAATRAEAYRQLAQAAAVLRELEPHSPIPYLIQRAVELGALPFPQLIRQLIRDANVLGELRREFGIQDDTESA